MNRAQKKVEEIFGVKIETPEETNDDKARQAQATLDYFETRGAGFSQQTCKACGLVFAYHWNSTNIKYCSITCLAEGLRRIGLKWNPEKSPEARWGRTIPAVVPPQALDILLDLVAIPEDPLPDTAS